MVFVKKKKLSHSFILRLPRLHLILSIQFNYKLHGVNLLATSTETARRAARQLPQLESSCELPQRRRRRRRLVESSFAWLGNFCYWLTTSNVDLYVRCIAMLYFYVVCRCCCCCCSTFSRSLIRNFHLKLLRASSSIPVSQLNRSSRTYCAMTDGKVQQKRK